MRPICVALLLGAFVAHGANAPVMRKDVLSKMALRFEPNPDVRGAAKYIARGANFQLHLAPAENWFEWKEPESGRTARVATRLINANRSARMEPADKLAGAANYFVGGPSKWRTDVTGFGRIRHREVYRGIDLVFHGEQGRLEYDFVLAPHADPRAIALELSGQRNLRISDDGDLVVATEAGEIRWKRPELFQMVDGKRTLVDGRFTIAENRVVRFDVGAYDSNAELVIDPALSYLTYLGGKGNETTRGLAVDGAGSIYVAGGTNSPDLKTRSALQPNFAGASAGVVPGDAFVAKFSAAGELVYLTYLGGSGDDGATAIAVDNGGNLYIAGATTSTDFPTVKPFQARFGGLGGRATIRTGDAFVAKLSASGNQLLYSTYLGGSLDDFATAIAVDSTGAAYVAGASLSANFPVTANAYQRTMRGSGGEPDMPCCNAPGWDPGDAFVAKLDPTGSQLVFATYLGGTKDDAAFTLALDQANNVYVGGCTISTDFPATAGSYQTRFGGSDSQNPFLLKGDGFVTKFNPQGTALIYSTYFGGFGDECVSAIAVDALGSVYMTGSTSTQNLVVTAGAFQKSYGGYIALPFQVEHLYGDAFVGKLNPAGSAFQYLSLLGGDSNDAGMAIAIDGSGNAYVTGFTESFDFPTSGSPLQPRTAGSGGQNLNESYGDAFLTVVNPTGTGLLYSSYFGGRFDDIGMGIAIDANGVAYLTGSTLSLNMPATANAFQRAYAGTGPRANGYAMGDAFVATFSGFPASPPKVSAITNSASNTSGVVSPGMIFVAYGVKLGPDALAGAQLDSNGRLAATVADSQMLFNERPAPIVYTSAGQFAGIVPYSVAGQASVQVVAVNQGQRSPPVTVQVSNAAPGLYSANYSGKGQAAAFNQDGTPNSQSNPAAKGSVVVFFGTGEGGLTPPPVDGTITDGLPTWRAINPLKFSVGGLPATVLYANTAPGQVAGLLQVNAQLAANTPSGAQPVVLTSGTTDSQTGLTIWVQ